jgi:predicted ATP-grasp superfamily ATP-dependent carboligase
MIRAEYGTPVDHTQPGSHISAPLLNLGKKSPKVLLLDGYSTRTLACVRSWGTRGLTFGVGGETRWDMSLWSRYARETFVYTSPKKDISRFIEDVNFHAGKFGADCVLPTSEAAILVCSKYRNELSCLPIVPRERDIELTFSKANTLKLAQALGILVPRTMHIPAAAQQRLEAVSLDFPIAIKSESSQIMLLAKANTARGTAYVRNRSELEYECASRFRSGEGVLLQEFIDGYGVGVSGLFSEGRPIALIGHRRIRESNPMGGPSAVAETIEIEPQLLKATTSLFEEIGFSGPAMAEYKIDRRTGRPYLMEINGRFWGTVLLAPAAGLDLPYLYWKLLNGIEIRPEEKQYEVGQKGRYLIGDTKCLAVCLKGKSHCWPGEFPNRLDAIKSYFSSFFDRRTRDLILTEDDPMPFFARLIQDFAK